MKLRWAPKDGAQEGHLIHMYIFDILDTLTMIYSQSSGAHHFLILSLHNGLHLMKASSRLTTWGGGWDGGGKGYAHQGLPLVRALAAAGGGAYTAGGV